jgi:hypothetical protein
MAELQAVATPSKALTGTNCVYLCADGTSMKAITDFLRDFLLVAVF